MLTCGAECGILKGQWEIGRRVLRTEPMSFKYMPDCSIPDSEVRCEAMTKPTHTSQDWRRNSHRCVRKATQSRAGRSVCALHARVEQIEYWTGQADAFMSRSSRSRRLG